LQTTFKEKILTEIDGLSESQLYKIYKFIHLLSTELILKTGTKEKRGSLKGIWKSSIIDEALISDAKKSLFPYNY
jgi:hypothetical protein